MLMMSGCGKNKNKKQQKEHQPPQRRGFRPKEEIKAGTISGRAQSAAITAKQKGFVKYGCKIWCL